MNDQKTTDFITGQSKRIIDLKQRNRELKEKINMLYEFNYEIRENAVSFIANDEFEIHSKEFLKGVDYIASKNLEKIMGVDL